MRTISFEDLLPTPEPPAWWTVPIERKPVQSSNLAEVGYHELTGTLEILFKSGGLYRYENVPAREVDAMLAAKSIGSYFCSYIRGYFECVRLDPVTLVAAIAA